MKEYTVKEIAEMLSANEETVRRWIRDGKLESNFTSKKSGHRVSETKLNEFLEKFPKYAVGAASGVATGTKVAGALGTLGVLSPMLLPGVPIIGATAAALMVMSQSKQKENQDINQQTITADQMIDFFQKQIGEMENKIREARMTADFLENQLNATKMEISGLESQLESHKTKLESWKKIKEDEK